jgi:hypothetical protein
VDVLHVKIDKLNDLLVGFCFIRSIDININEINVFNNYFSGIASGRKFGPLQEYRKNHMSRKLTFEAYLRGPFLATRIFRHSLNGLKKFHIIRKLFAPLQYIYLFILRTFYVCKNNN